jgi:hypothetical protein
MVFHRILYPSSCPGLTVASLWERFSGIIASLNALVFFWEATVRSNRYFAYNAAITFLSSSLVGKEMASPLQRLAQALHPTTQLYGLATMG